MVKSSCDRCQDFFHIKTASRDKIAPGLVSLQIDLTSDSINLQTIIGNREIRYNMSESYLPQTFCASRI